MGVPVVILSGIFGFFTGVVAIFLGYGMLASLGIYVLSSYAYAAFLGTLLWICAIKRNRMGAMKA